MDCDFAVTIPGTDDVDESMIAVPLRYGTRVIGAVVISKLGVGQFDEDDVRLLEVLGGHTSVALENARLYEAERREAERAKASLEISSALLELSRRLASAGPWQKCSSVRPSTPRGSWACRRPPSGSRTARATTSSSGRSSATLQERSRRRAAFAFPDELTRGFLAAQEPFVLDPAAIVAVEGLREAAAGGSVAVAPLRLEGDRLGFVVVAGPEGEVFDDRRICLLTGVAHQAKLAVANASSFESLEKTFLSTVEALAKALEANDEYTSSHARWITDTALLVGRELGLDTRALKRLELGALFHDIGKIGIPEAILSKPGPLTPEGCNVVRLHPELGAASSAPSSGSRTSARSSAAVTSTGTAAATPRASPAMRSRSSRASSSSATPTTR